MQQNIAQIHGPNLVLRLIETDDAEYVHALRTNPTFNTYLSEVSGTVEDQRRWIDSYKVREADGLEYYYIVARKDGTRCGTVRLYDLHGKIFTWGSWILDQNKHPKAALESAVLSFGVGFSSLKCDYAKVDVRVSNKHAEAFYRRFGMTETQRSEQDIYFNYERERFEADRQRHMATLAQAKP